MKSGTRISMPVLVVAAFVALPLISPRTAGSVYTMVVSTSGGNWRLIGLPLYLRDLEIVHLHEQKAIFAGLIRREREPSR